MNEANPNTIKARIIVAIIVKSFSIIPQIENNVLTNECTGANINAITNIVAMIAIANRKIHSNCFNAPP